MVLIVPFAIPYMAAAQDIGFRPDFEISRYSATPVNYLASPAVNRVWGWTADRFGSTELRLFPGLMAALLCGASVLRRPWRPVVLYAILALVAIGFSFGTNNPAYAFLIEHVGVLRGFRSMSRFAALTGCAVAVLAGFGMQTVLERTGWRRTATDSRHGCGARADCGRSAPIIPCLFSREVRARSRICTACCGALRQAP